MQKPLFVLFSIALLACERRPVAPPAPADRGETLAQIDDQLITSKDFQNLVDLIENGTPQKLQTLPQKSELLEQLINVELLYQAALKAGFDSRFEFKSRLADLYVEDLARKARESVTEEALKREYESQKDLYDQVSVKHILISFKDPKTGKARDAQEALKSIRRISEQISADPDSFTSSARQLSEDSSSRQGGEIGFFIARQMDPNFAKAAFSLKKVGDISPIVKSVYGYHILQLTGDRRGFEFHRESLMTSLLKKSQQSRLNDELNRLKSGRKIKIYDAALLKLAPLPPTLVTDPSKLVKPKETK